MDVPEVMAELRLGLIRQGEQVRAAAIDSLVSSVERDYVRFLYGLNRTRKSPPALSSFVSVPMLQITLDLFIFSYALALGLDFLKLADHNPTPDKDFELVRAQLFPGIPLPGIGHGKSSLDHCGIL